MNEIAWISPGNNPDLPKILYYRNPSTNNQWRPYYQHPSAVPDHEVPSFGQRSGGGGRLGPSRGFATMQELLRRGYRFVPSVEAERDRL